MSTCDGVLRVYQPPPPPLCFNPFTGRLLAPGRRRSLDRETLAVGRVVWVNWGEYVPSWYPARVWYHSRGGKWCCILYPRHGDPFLMLAAPSRIALAPQPGADWPIGSMADWEAYRDVLRARIRDMKNA